MDETKPQEEAGTPADPAPQDGATPAPQETPAPEPTPSVADAVREAGREEHKTKRSLNDLDPDIRRIVEDQVSAALSQKTQKGEYMTPGQFKEELEKERATWKAEADANAQFHQRLASEGIVPGTDAYQKVEASLGFVDKKALLTEEGVAMLIRAAGVSREQRQAEADSVDSVPVQQFQEGPASKQAEDARTYGRTPSASFEARLKQAEDAGGAPMN